MSKKIVIDATHEEETRVALIDNEGRLEDYDIESAARKLLKGNIFLAKVTRVEPSLQAAFVDYGGNRHGFLPFSEIHPDYYRIPIADKEKILEEEKELRRKLDEAAEAEEDGELDPEKARRIVEDHTRGSESSDDVEAKEGEAEEPKKKTTAKKSKKSEEEAPAENSLEAEIEKALTEGEKAAEEEQEAQAEEKPKRGRRKKTAAKKSEVQEIVDDETVEEANGNVVEPEEDEADDVNGNVAVSEEEEEANDVDGNVDSSDDDENNGNQNKGRRGRFRGRRGRGGRGGRNNRGGNRHNASRGQQSRDDDEFANPMQPLWNKIRRNYKIQEVIKRGQIMLIQVNKEERGNKGAAVTSYITLPGRYCVLMPNSAQGGGVSRKISDRKDRRKMRDILKSLEVPEGMSVILRTAGLTRTKTEIKRDHTYLTRLWNSIRELTLKSSAPALIHEEGNLLHRIIRDVYSKEFEEISVAGEKGYKETRNIMKMMMPSHAKRVVEYKEDTPLFIQNNVEKQIEAVHETTVQLKSGGYLVINPTEALVSVDVNSGRATRERHIEETALKTNLEAAEEMARQMRLRDLAGLVVIDFIDMENRKNNRLVERALQKALSKDRAKVQCGQISNFGLMELSRQRLRPSMTEKNFIECPHCHGKGIVRTVDGAALTILRAIETEGVQGATGKLKVEAPSDVLLFLLNFKRTELSALEERYGLNILFDMNDEMGASDYNIEANKPKKHKNQKNQKQNNKNQNRNQRGKHKDAANEDSNDDVKSDNDKPQKGKAKKAAPKKEEKVVEAEDQVSEDEKTEEVQEEKPKRGRKKAAAKKVEDKTVADEETAEAPKKKTTRGRKKKADEEKAEATDEKVAPKKGRAKKADKEETSSEEEKKPAKKTARKPKAKKDEKVVELEQPAPEAPVEEAKEPEYNIISEKTDDGKKKKGWWSRMLEK
jgi:ribonuclease E